MSSVSKGTFGHNEATLYSLDSGKRSAHSDGHASYQMKSSGDSYDFLISACNSMSDALALRIGIHCACLESCTWKCLDRSISFSPLLQDTPHELSSKDMLHGCRLLHVCIGSGMPQPVICTSIDRWRSGVPQAS